MRKIHEKCPEIKIKSIQWHTFDLHRKFKEVVKPKRGPFILLSEKETVLIKHREIRENDFYQPFADYLVNDLEECTKAIPLGGNKFGDKWGIPDVFGIYKFSETDPIRPPIEIISAEIKADTNQIVATFGQACSYNLFSHKVYLVVPKEAERDVGRIESLCSRFGIGLILFDRSNPQNPNFEIRTRAASRLFGNAGWDWRP